MNTASLFANGGHQNLSTGSAVFFDLDSDPWMPCPTWKVSKHVRQGILAYHPEQLSGHLSPRQWLGKKLWPTGYELQAKLAGRKTLNANYMIELFKYQWTINYSFKTVDLVFLDTNFLATNGREYVLYLHYFWEQDEYRWCFKDMAEKFGPSFQVAVLRPLK